MPQGRRVPAGTHEGIGASRLTVDTLSTINGSHRRITCVPAGTRRGGGHDVIRGPPAPAYFHEALWALKHQLALEPGGLRVYSRGPMAPGIPCPKAAASRQGRMKASARPG